VLVASSALALACSGKKGPPKKKQIILATEYHDQIAGAEAAQEVAQGMGILEDTPPVVYAKQVGARMAKFAPYSSFTYNFEVVDQVAPNAFALPGGYIYLSRGLLSLSNSEDELANVIGHEITHAVERHAAGRQAYEQRLNPFMMGYMRAGEIAAYGRDHERDADRGAQRMSALAGYDPEGMAGFLRSLDNTTRLQLGFSRLPSFFDTHPSTPERAATASARAKEIRWERKAGISKGRSDHLHKLEGLIVGENPAEGVFVDNRFLHVDLDFSLRFPPGWITINAREALVGWAPDGQAQVVLRVTGAGDDPQKAGEEYLEKESEHSNVKVTRKQLIQLNDYPAFRVDADSSGGGVATSSQVTWFSYGGLIYQISVAARSGAVGSYLGRGRATARSFRPLTQEERDSVMERRLHIAEAREGETLAQLSERVGNVFDLGATAVVNDLSVSARLPAGYLVKVATARRYVPKPRPAAPPAAEEAPPSPE
jgi:predicted Zn-dependent protease